MNNFYSENNIDQRICNNCLDRGNLDDMTVANRSDIVIYMCKECESSISSDTSKINYFDQNSSFVNASNKVLKDDLDNLVDDFKSKFIKLTSLSFEGG